MIQDNLRPGRRNPSGGQREFSAMVDNGVVRIPGPAQEFITHDLIHIVSAQQGVHVIGGVFLGKEPVPPVFE